MPLVAVAEIGQGGDGFGVGGVPALAGAFEAGRAGLTPGFGGTGADVPTLGGELGIADHVAAFHHVVQQSMSFSSRSAAWRFFPRRVVRQVRSCSRAVS